MPGSPELPWASPDSTILVHTPHFNIQPVFPCLDSQHIHAVDVEKVASEGHAATLQDHIASSTFCNLDEKQGPHPGQTKTSIVLEALTVAENIINYLMNCQEHMRSSLGSYTQHLQSANAKMLRAQEQAAQLGAKLRSAAEEKRRLELQVAMQHGLLEAALDYCCEHHVCDETCVHTSYLKAQMQYRHPEAMEAERQKMKQVEQQKDEMEKLKLERREMQQQLEAEIREVEMLNRELEEWCSEVENEVECKGERGVGIKVEKLQKEMEMLERKVEKNNMELKWEAQKRRREVEWEAQKLRREVAREEEILLRKEKNLRAKIWKTELRLKAEWEAERRKLPVGPNGCFG